MPKNEAKVKFTAETGDFNKNIEDARARMANLSSEMKLASAQFKNTGNSVEFLQTKQRILSDQLETAQAKTANLSAKLEVANRVYGEGSIEAEKLATQVNNARAAEARIANQITQVEKSLNSQSDATEQSQVSFDELTTIISQQNSQVKRLEAEYKSLVVRFGQTSSEAESVGAELKQVSTELSKSRARLVQAGDAADGLSRELKDVDSSAEAAGASVGDIAAGNVISDFATSGIQALAGLEESTRQYRNEQAKLATAAQATGQPLDRLKGSYNELYAITADETMSSTAVANMSAMGMSAENQQKAINAATGAWAQFGDSIPLDGLMESINESSKLGATLTGPVVDAINWANVSQEQWSASLSGNAAAQSAFNSAVAQGATTEDAMNAALAACSTEQERQSLLVNALDAGYGGLAASYRENNAAVIEANNAQAALTDAQAQLATQITPLQAQITNLAANGIGFLAQNFSWLAPIMVGAAVAFGALWLAMNGATIIQTVTTAFTALNAVMRANPIILVVSLIAGLVAAFITAYNTSETFRNMVNSAFQSIASVVSGAIYTAQSVVGSGISAIQGFFNNLSSVPGVVSGLFNQIKTFMSDPVNNAKSVIQGAINSIKGFFNFSISWPHIPMPHFTISPAGWQVGDLLKGSIPSIGVSFYAKGGILNGPTVFGFSGTNALVGGEAGPEAVAPIDVLQGYIDQSIDGYFGGSPNALLAKILGAITKLDSGLGAKIEKHAPRSLDIGNERGVFKLMNKISKKWS